MLTFYLVLVCFSLSAQQKQNEVSKKYRTGNLVVKWSPLHLLSHFPTFQVAVEHKLSKRISIQYEWGPVINFDGLLIRSDSDKHGFKAKLQARTYIPSAWPHWNFFVGPELYYNKVNYKMWETYRVTHKSGIEYYENIAFDRLYREKGFSLIGGVQFKAHRFWIDFQVGISARFIQYNSFTRPNPSTHELIPNEEEGYPLEPIRETLNLVSPTGCVKICFVILWLVLEFVCLIQF